MSTAKFFHFLHNCTIFYTLSIFIINISSSYIDMSLGNELWIVFTKTSAITNSQYVYFIAGAYIPDTDIREKGNIVGLAAMLLISRGLTYAYIKGKDPFPGRAFTVINTGMDTVLTGIISFKLTHLFLTIFVMFSILETWIRIILLKELKNKT